MGHLGVPVIKYAGILGILIMGVYGNILNFDYFMFQSIVTLLLHLPQFYLSLTALSY